MRYSPHEYQRYATEYIETHPVAAVLLDMGLGKTSITLTALNNLLFDSFEVRRILVIAPLRVARNTWGAEIEKWDHLNSLHYSVAVGTETERLSALKKQADIYLINRENVQWLISESGIPFDFDMVVIDELSSFKNHQTKRFRALMKVRPKVKRIVGLTGTPSSNGLMDLWAEFRLLDMGERLGRFIGQYRTSYFRPDKQNGQVVFSYKPLPGAEKQIYSRILLLLSWIVTNLLSYVVTNLSDKSACICQKYIFNRLIALFMRIPHGCQGRQRRLYSLDSHVEYAYTLAAIDKLESKEGHFTHNPVKVPKIPPLLRV